MNSFICLMVYPVIKPLEINFREVTCVYPWSTVKPQTSYSSRPEFSASGQTTMMAGLEMACGDLKKWTLIFRCVHTPTQLHTNTHTCSASTVHPLFPYSHIQLSSRDIVLGLLGGVGAFLLRGHAAPAARLRVCCWGACVHVCGMLRVWE